MDIVSNPSRSLMLQDAISLDISPIHDLRTPGLENRIAFEKICSIGGYSIVFPASISATNRSGREKTDVIASAGHLTVGSSDSITTPKTPCTSPSIPSPESGPPIAILTANHEESCAKCRMTEAEHQKCKMERRREQNRTSQRKFRARKEAKIRDAASQVAGLETYIKYVEARNTELEKINKQLFRAIDELRQTSTPRNTLTSITHPPQLARFGFNHTQKPSQRSVAATDTCTSIGTTNSPVDDDLFEFHMPLFDHELLPPV